MQKEFENNSATVAEQFLKIVDLFVASVPDLFRNQILHARDQHIFVMRAIEDADAAFAGCIFMDAPQEVVRQLFFGRLFEGMYVAALRVDAAENVTNGAILAAGIHTL